MSLAPKLPEHAPDFARRYVNLADARLGATAVICSDDFFASMQRMLQPGPAEFIPGRYDDHGKWMDGWESRRRRGAGHDWCIIRLARPGLVHGVDLDTSHFTGNYPPAASIEACMLETGEPDGHTIWQPLLASVPLNGNQHHYHATAANQVVSHIRVHIYPDGGLARLRVYGSPRYAPADLRPDGLQNVASVLLGARVLACNNQHFGMASQLLLPDPGKDMGDGWETRRRREPGNDWCIIALARPAMLREIEVDTAYFKGNYPDRCGLHAAHVSSGSDEAIISQAMFWPSLLPPQALSANALHRFDKAIATHDPVTHVRFDIYPDGGVSRLRLWAAPSP